MDFWKNEEIVHFCADKLTFYGHNLRTKWIDFSAADCYTQIHRTTACASENRPFW
jgi:hypothetical protein